MSRRIYAYSTLTLTLLGCKGAALCDGRPLEAEIVGNHGHALELPEDGIQRAGRARLAVRGGTHQHALILTDSDVRELDEGKTVKTRVSSVNAHTHEITVRCAR